jgi:hypothetical protein
MATLDEEYITKGVWWLPETPNIEVTGELRYSPGDGLLLELQGDLHALKDGRFYPPTSQDEPIIHGITVKGGAVSLLNSTVVSGSVNIGEYIGIPEAVYHVSFAFFGFHVSCEEDLTFKKLSIRFSHLDDWMDQNPFQTEYPLTKDKQYIFNEVTFRYTKPDALNVNVDDYLISFIFDGPSVQRPSTGELILSQKAWVTIQKNTGEMHLRKFLEVIRRIQDFLTLAVSYPVFPNEVEGYTNNKKIILNNEKEHNTPIKIIYNRPWQQKNIRQIHPSEMLFTLKTIEGCLESSLQKWFTNDKKIKPVLDVYFSLLYREQIYAEMRFLGIIQCIESYHRRMFGGKYLPDDVYLSGLYRQLVKAIPCDLDKSFIESLRKGKLYYANEYSLRKRLLDLSKHLAEYLPVHFLIHSRERNSFIERVCNTRNYLTHYEPESLNMIASTGKEQYELYRKLRLMLDILLMETIGFEREQIKEMFRKNGLYKNYFVSLPNDTN